MLGASVLIYIKFRHEPVDKKQQQQQQTYYVSVDSIHDTLLGISLI